MALTTNKGPLTYVLQLSISLHLETGVLLDRSQNPSLRAQAWGPQKVLKQQTGRITF